MEVQQLETRILSNLSPFLKIVSMELKASIMLSLRIKTKRKAG